MTAPPNHHRRCRTVVIERMDYRAALDLQHRIVAARLDGRLDQDLLLLLTHPPVFTLGRRGGRENLLISSEDLRRRRIEVIQVERGGNITYHGPGQLVAYVIVDLRNASLTVEEFVSGLETAMVRTAAQWQIKAVGDARNRGVWVGKAKLGSIGLTVRRGVTFHGLALNVDLDLTPFAWINPCGLQGIRMTSMARERGEPIAVAAVQKALQAHFGAVFRMAMEPLAQSALETILGPDAESEVTA
jgi:lipoate-protein ligase B